METLDCSSTRNGIENQALETENDDSMQNATETRPFTPPVPGDKFQFIPEIVPECPHLPNARCQHLPEMMTSDHVGSGKKFGDGFKEVEIFNQMKKKAANRVHPIDAVIESQSINIINETKEEFQVNASIFEISKDSKNQGCQGIQTVEEYDKLFETTKKKRRKGKKDDKKIDGLVMKKKRNKCQSTNTEKPIEEEEISKKYGVTMEVKSGVTRTPWHQTNGSSGEGSSKEGSGSSTRMKRDVTEETILPSTSTSANSFLSHKSQIEVEENEDEENDVDEEKTKPIPTISKMAANKEKKVYLTAISIATYKNIQKEGVIKRPNCILCSTATITFIVTIVLTIALLIAPKSLSKKEDTLPSGLVSHITSANKELPKANRKTGEFTRNIVAVNISHIDFIDSTSNDTLIPINITEIIPKR